MALDRATFLVEFPEFSDVPSSAVDRRLALADSTLNQSLGVWREHLCFLWSAHYLYLRFDVGSSLDANGMNDQENQGVTTSQSANTTGLSSSTSVSALTASENAVEADFSRTQYGLEYLSTLRQVLPPAILCS